MSADFQALKLAILELVGLSKDALHVYVGLLVFLVAVALLSRRHRASWWWALLAVGLVALGGEVLDVRRAVRTGAEVEWGASVRDFLNTLFWPAVLATLGHARIITWRGVRSRSANARSPE